MTRSEREIVLSDDALKRELRRRTRRDFLIGGITGLGAIGGYEWMKSVEDDDGLPHLERKVLDFNGKLAHGYFSDSHRMPVYSAADVRRLKVNGDIGVKNRLTAWRLSVFTGSGPALHLSLADIQALPKIDLVTRFCCIEGWSTIVQWSGARFSDFTRKYFPAGRQLPGFVHMATPDQEYYVGLDIKSAMHPQTLLAYELNREPLTAEHGAPLRLAIPVKYGIKSIKRIGSIRYTADKPGDYWAEQGYDWFAGL